MDETRQAGIASFSDQQWGNLTAIFKRVFAATAVEVFLFGSRSRGEARRGADVDLAFASDGSLDRPLVLLREALENSTLPYQFDLVDLKGANAALRSAVAREGVLIWTQHS